MFPISIYSELTPNPNTMKFVADRVIFPNAEPVEYTSASEAKGSSALALNLFNFPFIRGVFIAGNFITLTKSQDLSWDLITFELREFLREHLLHNEFAVESLPEPKKIQSASKENPAASTPVGEPSEYDEAIIKLIDQYVKPAVESDGGAIDFVSFSEGTVTVQLRGSCAGCPSSTVTLKNGIEQMLTAEMPVVKEVVALSV